MLSYSGNSDNVLSPVDVIPDIVLTNHLACLSEQAFFFGEEK